MSAIKLKSNYCSPRGTFEAGHVLEVGDKPGQVPQQEADQLVERHYAVPVESPDDSVASPQNTDESPEDLPETEEIVHGKKNSRK